MFYGTPKAHKPQKQQQQKRLEELTVRPVISNIGTATYEIVKYLNKLLTPLRKSDYNILNTQDHIRSLREETIPAEYKINSFGVKNLFTNVPLDNSIDFILKKVYDEKKIQTIIPKRVLKELPYLSIKQLHFTLNNNIYIQCGGVSMCCPLGPLLANIFMTTLEEDLIPTLKSCFCNWKQYVDDTHAYVEPAIVELI